MEPGEEPLAVARREFEEETGHPAPVGGEIALGEIRKKSGKVVTAWAVEGDLDPATAHSNTFPMEWPPNSGQFIDVPEFDRVAWFTADEAGTPDARRGVAARRTARRGAGEDDDIAPCGRLAGRHRVAASAGGPRPRTTPPRPHRRLRRRERESRHRRTVSAHPHATRTR